MSSRTDGIIRSQNDEMIEMRPKALAAFTQTKSDKNATRNFIGCLTLGHILVIVTIILCGITKVLRANKDVSKPVRSAPRRTLRSIEFFEEEYDDAYDDFDIADEININVYEVVDANEEIFARKTNQQQN